MCSWGFVAREIPNKTSGMLSEISLRQVLYLEAPEIKARSYLPRISLPRFREKWKKCKWFKIFIFLKKSHSVIGIYDKPMFVSSTVASCHISGWFLLSLEQLLAMSHLYWLLSSHTFLSGKQKFAAKWTSASISCFRRSYVKFCSWPLSANLYTHDNMEGSW